MSLAVGNSFAQSTPNQDGEAPVVGHMYKIRSIIVNESNGSRNVVSERYLRATNFEGTNSSMEGVLKADAPDFSTMRGDEVNRYYWVLRENSNGKYFTNYGGKGYIGYAVGIAYTLDGNVSSTNSPNIMGCTDNQDEIFYFDSFESINRRYGDNRNGQSNGSTSAGALLEGYALKFAHRSDNKTLSGQYRNVWMANDGEINFGSTSSTTTSYLNTNTNKYWSAAFVFEPVDIPPLDVTFTRSDNGKAVMADEGYDYYTTFYWPFPVTIPSDVNVWQIDQVGTGESNTEVILKEPATESFWYNSQHIIPERTPVLLSMAGSEADESVTKTAEFNIYLTDEKDPITGTGFTGTLLNTPIDGYNWSEMEHPNVFVLGKRNGRVAFYWLKSSQNTGNKCYFKVSEAAAAKGMVMMSFYDEVSGISEVKVPEDSQTVYDLQGRRVEHPAHGIYIRGGKKYCVK